MMTTMMMIAIMTSISRPCSMTASSRLSPCFDNRGVFAANLGSSPHDRTYLMYPCNSLGKNEPPAPPTALKDTIVIFSATSHMLVPILPQSIRRNLSSLSYLSIHVMHTGVFTCSMMILLVACLSVCCRTTWTTRLSCQVEWHTWEAQTHPYTHTGYQGSEQDAASVCDRAVLLIAPTSADDAVFFHVHNSVSAFPSCHKRCAVLHSFSVKCFVCLSCWSSHLKHSTDVQRHFFSDGQI